MHATTSRPPKHASGKAWLWPKEHGAYAQLAVPLCAALVQARLELGAIAIGLAGIAAFLAHEPALVLLGHRGVRAKERDRDVAIRALIAYGLVAAGMCIVAILRSFAVLPLLVIPISLGLALTVMVLRKAEKTLAGEVLAAATLSSITIPVWGLEEAGTFTVWAVWCLGFTALTTSVRTIIASAKRRSSTAELLVRGLATLVFVFGLVEGTPYIAAASPMMIAAWTISLALPSARHLRRIGWISAASCTMSAVWIIVRAFS